MTQLAKRTTYENGKPTDHFTRVPNELINHLGLTGIQKLVLIKHLSEEFKTKSKPDSERKASKKLGVSRNTYSDATEELVQLRLLEPAGSGRWGKQETYTVHLERLTDLSGRDATGSNGVPVEATLKRQTGSKQSQLTGSKVNQFSPELAQNRAMQKIAENTIQEDCFAALEGSSLGNGDERLGSDVGLVDSADSSEPSHSVENGNPEPKARLHASPGPQYIAPRPFTKAEINSALLTPDGQRVSSNVDDLYYDLQNLFLPEVRGEYLRDDDFDRLVILRGVEFCRFWSYWLRRKIAWYYDVKKEPVPKPTALYIRAVEQQWEADPRWPMFDEERHTWAAQAQADLRARHKADNKSKLQRNEELDESAAVELEDELACFR